MNGTFQKNQGSWTYALGKQEAENPSPESHEVYGSRGQTNQGELSLSNLLTK